MEKSEVTQFFLKYFEENGIKKEQISEEMGIATEKFSSSYSEPLTAEEFLRLCVYLQIRPEMIQEKIKKERAAQKE